MKKAQMQDHLDTMWATKNDEELTLESVIQGIFQPNSLLPNENSAVIKEALDNAKKELQKLNEATSSKTYQAHMQHIIESWTNDFNKAESQLKYFTELYEKLSALIEKGVIDSALKDEAEDYNYQLSRYKIILEKKVAFDKKYIAELVAKSMDPKETQMFFQKEQEQMKSYIKYKKDELKTVLDKEEASELKKAAIIRTLVNLK